MDIDSIKKQYPEFPIGRADNLTNKKFGQWTVLYRTKNDDKATVWVCQCNCDNKTIKPVLARSLKSGGSTNCGCKRLITIANKADKQIHQRDEQGNIILKHCYRCNQWLSLDNFYKNKTQKDGYCGECKKCQNTSSQGRYNIYKKNAKRRNIPFDLSKDEFNNLTKSPCAYCGELNEYNGIDRIDSKNGYNINNCNPCCEICNKMKLDYPFDFWINHIKKVVKYVEENKTDNIKKEI